MTRTVRTIALLAVCLFAPHAAEASFHLISISEVLSGFGADPSVQYVELRMDTVGQQFVSGTRLAVFDTTGVRTDLAISGSNVAVGASQRKILYATSAFATATGLTPDFTIAAGLVTPTGMVCWGRPANPAVPGQYIDCVAFGGYAGPPAPANPPSTTDPPGDGTLSLTRVSGTVFAKSSSAADFALRVPGPCNNANQCAVLGPSGCGNGNVDAGEACDDGNTADGDGCSAMCQVESLPGTVCGDANGDGRVTVTDGVQVLRAAAGLSSDCTPARCDVDGNGTISVTDGVNVLREAAALPSVCD